MKPFEFHRPKSLDEALPLVRRLSPLAGGTWLTPRRRRLHGVVDLQDLALDGLRAEAAHVIVGAGIRLQTLVEIGEPIPAALAKACRLEAGLNLRNMASLAGTVVTADGRSPLATVLLAMGTSAVVEPGAEKLEIEALWDLPGRDLSGRLIVRLLLPRPAWLAYEQVARSPVDRPVVCAAACGDGQGGIRLALGGFGPRPILVPLERAEAGLASRAAAAAYAAAGDAWASAEYRSEVAGILARRVAAGGAGA